MFYRYTNVLNLKNKDMNIFPELTRQLKQSQLERDKAAAKELHLSLKEYYTYKNREKQQKIEHENYLNSKGITEEQYQRKLRRKEKWKKLWEGLQGCLVLLSFIGAFLLIGTVYYIVESSKSLKTIFLTIGAIVLLGFVLIYIITPIFFLVWVAVEKWLKSSKIVTAIFTFLIASTIIVGFVYACGDLPSKTYHIRWSPDKY